MLRLPWHLSSTYVLWIGYGTPPLTLAKITQVARGGGDGGLLVLRIDGDG